jgi:WD40 repeat protein
MRVLDANTGKEIFSFDLGTAPRTSTVVAPVFTNDGSRIAKLHNKAGNLTNTGSRLEWLIFDAKSGKLVTSFDDPGDGSRSPSSLPESRIFSDDGSQFICAVDNTVYTFDSTTGQPVHTLRGNETSIGDTVALPNGRVRTVELGGTIREWDLRPVEPVRTAVVEGSPGPGPQGAGFRRTAISADGAWLAGYIPAADHDGTSESVRVWDAAGTARPIDLTPPHRESGPGALFAFPQLSADGKRVALFRNELPRRRDTREQEKVDPARVSAPDVTVWDVASREVLLHRELQLQASVVRPLFRMVQLSPDGATLTLIEFVPGTDMTTSTLKVIDVATGRDRSKIEEAGIGPGIISFSPNGRRIAVGLAGPPGTPAPFGFRPVRQVAVYDAGAGERISTIESDAGAAPTGLASQLQMNVLAWSPDGSRLAFAESGGSRIHLIDVATGKRVKTLEASSVGGIISAGAGDGFVFSPDGARIACIISQRVGRPNTVNVLDADSGRVVLSLPAPGSTGFGQALRFSPDGRRLICFAPMRETLNGTAAGITKQYVQVTTLDATPRPPEPQQP